MKKFILIFCNVLFAVNCFAGSELWDCQTTCKEKKNIDAMECEHCYPAKPY